VGQDPYLPTAVLAKKVALFETLRYAQGDIYPLLSTLLKILNFGDPGFFWKQGMHTAGLAAARDCVKSKHGFQEWDGTPKNWRKNYTLSQLLVINPLPAG
jgi:hypothetical protein